MHRNTFLFSLNSNIQHCQENGPFEKAEHQTVLAADLSHGAGITALQVVGVWLVEAGICNPLHHFAHVCVDCWHSCSLTRLQLDWFLISSTQRCSSVRLPCSIIPAYYFPVVILSLSHFGLALSVLYQPHALVFSSKNSTFAY